MAQVQLVNRPIGSIGYGLMGLTWRPPHLLPSTQTAFAAMSTALSRGANFWNGGELYGTPERNSCHLLREFWERNPGTAEKVVLSIKGGLKKGQMVPDGSEENIRRSVDDCLEALGGTKTKIDIFECARVDQNTPIEDTVSYLGKLVKEGKIGGIGLSEVRASTISKAAKVHPIAAVEVELSLWTTDIMRNGIAETCSRLDIPIVAYSPLSRGALAGDTVRRNADIPDGDVRKTYPKFQDDVLEYNNKITDEVEKLAKRKGCTKAQVAIAWVRSLSGRTMKVMSEDGTEKEVVLGTIIPIPGATTKERVQENTEMVELSDGEMEEIAGILQATEVKGDRYPKMGMAHAEG